MKNQHTNHLIQLTLATFFISTSGALGRFIDLPIPITIWWRCILAGAALLAFNIYKKYNLKITSTSDKGTIVVTGILLGAHWITYFLALQLSNVALGMLSLFTFPVLTAFLEPLLIKTKFDPFYIILGILVLLGIYILAPEFNLESSQVKGVLFGLLSAVFYSLRNILTKKLTTKYNGSSVMFYQSLVVSLTLTPTLFYFDSAGLQSQFPYIIFLGLVTTTLGHTLLVNSLKHFTVSTASIINSVQPIFGIIIAFFFLNEIPTLNTFLGGSLILATVIIESIRSRNN
ncbi:DMT family transporter [Aestuariibaculum sediminum]|uniref:DMT family transporter n=1 Tax=Aestuariibaculum sediminum TaxID=2770637 RepID=A0A8J6PYA8_9FLAO|nr:DMT family transporter [Aestuariibaculum sediminum]MBD0830858.1 DMT family transporter [Aestuariibaculum sediminum]